MRIELAPTVMFASLYIGISNIEISSSSLSSELSELFELEDSLSLDSPPSLCESLEQARLYSLVLQLSLIEMLFMTTSVFSKYVVVVFESELFPLFICVSGVAS